MVDIEVPNTPDPQVALLLATLDAATEKWREQLGAVSEEALVWQPVPGGHSIGAILLHIADVEGYILQDVLVGTPRPASEPASLLSEETEQYAGKWPTPPCEPLAVYYAKMDPVRQRSRETLGALSDLTQTRTVRGKTATVRWLITHVIAHDSYHGGQAVLLHEMYKAGQCQ